MDAQTNIIIVHISSLKIPGIRTEGGLNIILDHKAHFKYLGGYFAGEVSLGKVVKYHPSCGGGVGGLV